MEEQNNPVAMDEEKKRKYLIDSFIKAFATKHEYFYKKFWEEKKNLQNNPSLKKNNPELWKEFFESERKKGGEGPVYSFDDMFKTVMTLPPSGFVIPGAEDLKILLDFVYGKTQEGQKVADSTTILPQTPPQDPGEERTEYLKKLLISEYAKEWHWLYNIYLKSTERQDNLESRAKFFVSEMSSAHYDAKIRDVLYNNPIFQNLYDNENESYKALRDFLGLDKWKREDLIEAEKRVKAFVDEITQPSQQAVQEQQSQNGQGPAQATQNQTLQPETTRNQTEAEPDLEGTGNEEIAAVENNSSADELTQDEKYLQVALVFSYSKNWHESYLQFLSKNKLEDNFQSQMAFFDKEKKTEIFNDRVHLTIKGLMTNDESKFTKDDLAVFEKLAYGKAEERGRAIVDSVVTTEPTPDLEGADKLKKNTHQKTGKFADDITLDFGDGEVFTGATQNIELDKKFGLSSPQKLTTISDDIPLLLAISQTKEVQDADGVKSSKQEVLATFTKTDDGKIVMKMSESFYEDFKSKNPGVLPTTVTPKDGVYEFEVAKLNLSKDGNINDIQLKGAGEGFGFFFSALGFQAKNAEGQKGIVKSEGVPYDIAVGRAFLEEVQRENPSCTMDENNALESSLYIGLLRDARKKKADTSKSITISLPPDTTAPNGAKVVLRSIPVPVERNGETVQEFFNIVQKDGKSYIYVQTTDLHDNNNPNLKGKNVPEFREIHSVSMVNDKDNNWYLSFDVNQGGNSSITFNVKLSTADYDKLNPSLEMLHTTLGKEFERADASLGERRDYTYNIGDLRIPVFGMNQTQQAYATSFGNDVIATLKRTAIATQKRKDEEERRKLEEEWAKINKEWERIKQERQNLDERRRNLDNEKRRLDERRRELDKELDNLEAKRSELERQRQELDQEEQKLDEEKSLLKQKQEELEKQKQDLEKQKQDLDEEWEKFEKEKFENDEEKERRRKELQEKQKKLDQEWENFEKRRQDLDKKIEKYNDDRENLNKKIKKYNDDKKDFDDKLEKYKGDKKKLDDDRKELDGNIKKLEDDRKKLDDDRKKLDENLEKYKDDRKKLDDEWDKFEEEWNKFEENRRKFDEERKNLEEERKKLEEERKRLEEERENLEEERRNVRRTGGSGVIVPPDDRTAEPGGTGGDDAIPPQDDRTVEPGGTGGDGVVGPTDGRTEEPGGTNGDGVVDHTDGRTEDSGGTNGDGVIVPPDGRTEEHGESGGGDGEDNPGVNDGDGETGTGETPAEEATEQPKKPEKEIKPLPGKKPLKIKPINTKVRNGLWGIAAVSLLLSLFIPFLIPVFWVAGIAGAVYGLGIHNEIKESINWRRKTEEERRKEKYKEKETDLQKTTNKLNEKQSLLDDLEKQRDDIMNNPNLTTKQKLKQIKKLKLDKRISDCEKEVSKLIIEKAKLEKEVQQAELKLLEARRKVLEKAGEKDEKEKTRLETNKDEADKVVGTMDEDKKKIELYKKAKRLKKELDDKFSITMQKRHVYDQAKSDKEDYDKLKSKVDAGIKLSSEEQERWKELQKKLKKLKKKKGDRYTFADALKDSTTEYGSALSEYNEVKKMWNTEIRNEENPDAELTLDDTDKDLKNLRRNSRKAKREYKRLTEWHGNEKVAGKRAQRAKDALEDFELDNKEASQQRNEEIDRLKQSITSKKTEIQTTQGKIDKEKEKNKPKKHARENTH